jgi:DNA-binding NarL/FixJ family response regulator
MAAVDAVAAVNGRVRSAVEFVTRLETSAFESGALDVLVTAYRASPELLAIMLRRSVDQDRLGAFIRRVGDDDLATKIGYPVAGSDDERVRRLTTREMDVFGLLRQGLTNGQIAGALFISEATVKLHAHHIYDKLGIRSRTALTIQAALERADQATSATGTSDSSEPDS